MKKINLVEANKLLHKWASANAYESAAMNKSIDFIYKIQEVQRLVNAAVKASGIESLYRARLLLVRECNYYDSANSLIAYKNPIDKETETEIKERYKAAKADLDFVLEEIKKIELNTYIEMN
jgi:hypothetical protein